jgi:hypothetical protein
MQQRCSSLVLIFVAACTNGVSSTEDAERAYAALDKSVGKAIQLGFDGFNAASSANIAPQMTSGDAAGSLTVTGQVDQGSSDNKTMRLSIAMTGYSDGSLSVNGDATSITYATGDTLPALELDLKGIPDGTVSGSLAGSYSMSGDLDGNVTLDLELAGMLQAGSDGEVERVPGATTVTGTAVSASGTYDVNVTL